MDLDVGQHCSVSTCNVNDLLPIKCLKCQAHFCRDHFAIDRHECISSSESKQRDAEWNKRSTCGFTGCKKPSLASAFDSSASKSDIALNDALCPQCTGAFCVTHRYPDAHECSGPIIVSSEALEPGSKAYQVDAAKTLLAKNFPETNKQKDAGSLPASASTSKPKVPKDPAKLAKFKAVELIKMRHKAIPGDPKDKNISVPLDRRLHVFVSNEVAGENQPVLMWFRKELVGGRILDMLNVRFNLTRTPTRLVTVHDEEQADVQLDKAIGEQASDGAKLLVRIRT